MIDKGYVHIYTGNGKGKTTASFGLALRAVGNGYKVFIGQFIKGLQYSEIKTFKERLSDLIQVEQFGRGCFIRNKPTEEDIHLAKEGLQKMRDVLKSGEYDVVIFDEANVAIYFKLFSVEELLDVLKERDENTEIIITGRYAPDRLIEYADLVTEMKEIKHYYQKGVKARKGIES